MVAVRRRPSVVSPAAGAGGKSVAIRRPNHVCAVGGIVRGTTLGVNRKIIQWIVSRQKKQIMDGNLNRRLKKSIIQLVVFKENTTKDHVLYE